jgi:hypothetical protein
MLTLQHPLKADRSRMNADGIATLSRRQRVIARP